MPDDAFDEAQRLHAFGRLSDAEAIYRRILARDPNHADALHALGLVAYQVSKHELAVELIGRAVALNPAVAHYHNNLGSALQELGRLEEARTHHERAAALNPRSSQAHNNLGNILGKQGRPDDAIAHYTLAIQIDPNFAVAHLNLGSTLLVLDRASEALAPLESAVRLRPDATEGYAKLGIALDGLHRLGEAADALKRALALQPSLSSARNDLAGVLLRQGRVDEAIEQFEQALRDDPTSALIRANLMQARHHRDGEDPAALFAAHREWAALHADPLAPAAPIHANDPSPQRRMRVGYVSGDFRHHPVGRFMLPLLEAHDRSIVEIACYMTAHGAANDPITAQLREQSDGWHDIAGLDGQELAQLIRAHAIDVLVDLSGHTAHNRLGVFARKPAPVQMTWLGYPDTTGMRAIDYRITDATADPPGLTESLHSEELIRIPGGFLCYRLPADVPQIVPLPAAESGHITFGSINRISKVTPQMMRLWSDILAQVEGSRLIVQARALSDPKTRELLQQALVQSGLPADRFELVGAMEADRDHLEIFNRIDIALDTFPYTGTTTTFEALAMGVPVVTIAGATHVSRVSASILTHAGLERFVASTPQQYVSIAVDLAKDVAALESVRGGLRDRLQSSSLCDPDRFARAVERVYRAAWQRWCEAKLTSRA